MDQNINFYGIVILLRKLRECGIFTEKRTEKNGCGTDRRGQRR